jgi:hypothetical protein
MKLVQTLVVRDEADIVGTQVAYHLNAGVDFVLATDHDSQDGTIEILESYARQGHLRLFREQGEMRESAWRTRMARLAATEYRADWIINTDADEFWMPRRGTLKESLQAVPDGFGVVWAITRHFVPRSGGEDFADRMTIRLCAASPLNDPTSPYRPHAKAAHRADAEIVVLFGSHDVVSSKLVPLRGWYPVDVLHFPFRSREQYERKGVRRARGDKPLGQYVKAFNASEKGRVDELFCHLTVNDAALEAGRASGALVVDTRLRDALRALRSESSGSGTAIPGSFEEEARAAAEADALLEANIVRTNRRLDVLAARLSAVEDRAWSRLSRRVVDGAGAVRSRSVR